MARAAHFLLRRIAPALTAVAAALAATAACHSADGTLPPTITLVSPAGSPGQSFVEVAGTTAAERAALGARSQTTEDWQRVLGVRVKAAASEAGVPVAGKYTIAGSRLRFAPLFPFDPGRDYEVTFDRSAIPGRAAGSAAPVTTTIVLPASAPAAPAFVTHVYPSANVVPENQLRIYIHFSAPMGRRGGLEHVRLLDEAGREVKDPFLPVDAEFWNAERTRYTLFFDPGRQKRGILPNREMGASLVAGRRYTLVVRRDWIDGNGHPLRDEYTRPFRVGPPDLSPLAPARWRVVPPEQGSRQPITVVFPEPLDHGLLTRAVGVRRDGAPVVGEIAIDAGETRWSMTPSEPWRAGRYELIALPILEDRAGNRIGRAFEIEGAGPAAGDPEPVLTSLPFSLAGAGR